MASMESAAEQQPPTTNPEPVLTINVITGLVVALAAVLVAFNVPLTREQTVAVVGLVAAGYPVAAFIARRFVAPWARVVATRKPDGTVTAGPAAVAATGAEVSEPVDVELVADPTVLPRRAREDGGN